MVFNFYLTLSYLSIQAMCQMDIKKSIPNE